MFRITVRLCLLFINRWWWNVNSMMFNCCIRVCHRLEISSISKNKNFIMFDSLDHKMLLKIWKWFWYLSKVSLESLSFTLMTLLCRGNESDLHTALSLRLWNIERLEKVCLTVWRTETQSWFMPVVTRPFTVLCGFFSFQSRCLDVQKLERLSWVWITEISPC